MSDLTRKEQFLNYIAHPNDACPDPMTREEYLLKEIAEHKDEPSGAQLPNPTESDKGKFAHVNSETGDLEYAEASGGSEFFIVTAEVQVSSMFQPTSVTVDKTYAEIKAAMNAGTPVLLRRKHKYAGVPVFLEMGHIPVVRPANGESVCATTSYVNGTVFDTWQYNIDANGATASHVTFTIPT